MGRTNKQSSKTKPDSSETNLHLPEPQSDPSQPNEESPWAKTQHSISSILLPLISQQEELCSLLYNDDNSAKRAKQAALVDTCQQLFQCLEWLAELKEGGDGDRGDDDLETTTEESLPCSLSGLTSLYTHTDPSSTNSDLVDMETIWGQVDLQNNSLLPLLKKAAKKLAKSVDADEVRLLDMQLSDDEEEEAVEEDDEGSAASNLESGGDESGEEEMDDDARRIRERMEKAMADMDSDNELDMEQDDEPSTQQKPKATKTQTKEESIIDPTREQMQDGFFDLHEMEAFADEEEEYLPDDAYGTEMPDSDDDDTQDKKSKKKVLPHIKARKGESSDSESGSEDEDELTKRYKPNSVRRKKYRADDEVEALYDLYNANNEDEYEDSGDEGEIAPEDMTAADLFGKPDKKLIKKYQTRQKEVDKGFDEDSWDANDFAEDGVGWRDEEEEEEDMGDNQGSEEEEEPADQEEEADNNDQTSKLSSHAIQSQKLQERTLLIEQEMMAEKPWRMRGETRGTDRPTDSLLDSTPEFEVTFKPPPIISAQHTASIEEVIKKRIIDEDWDDVVPRELPDIGVHNRREAPEVSQEKSKLGLGELYEREYLKKTTGFDRDAHEKETEEDAAKEEMKRLFADLCSKLDALSNYHFAPRPVAEEADVVKQNVPAIAMEEVLPLHVSGSRGVAPEEVYAGGKGRDSVLKGESEMNQAERNRIRNAKKSARRKARKQKLADEKLISKLQPGLGLNNPYEKRKLREELQMARASGKVVVAQDKGMVDESATGKVYQTSTNFFQKMQQNVESMVRGDEDGGVRGKKRRKGLSGGQVSSAYKL